MITTACRTRLSKLLPLLASDKPGEVVAAATAITKILKTDGSDFHELTAILSAPKQESLAENASVAAASIRTLIAQRDAAIRRYQLAELRVGQLTTQASKSTKQIKEQTEKDREYK